MVKFYFFVSLFFSLTFFSGNSNAADIRIFVDRQHIVVNESFNLVFEADGSVDANPDFSPLSVYFDILNRSQSSNMTLVNGNFNRKTVWTLVLLAKQAGNYALPVIEFGKDKSRSLNIKIQKASTKKSSADQNLFLEAEIDQNSIYVQAQLLYTLKLFRAVDIQNASLTEPELSHADAIVEKLGEDKRYQTTRNGVRFVVIERRYAIFPQQSGQLEIKPIEFNGQIVSQRRSFFDSGMLNNTSKRLYSKPFTIDVKPVPTAFTNKNWLPSSELKLVDEWPDNASFKVGEPITRTISLIANGLTAAQLPELAVKNILGIKQYPDQPTLNDTKDTNGIIGIRQEKIAFIPTKPGPLTLPELNISWWNTKTEQLEYTRIESKKINIHAADTTQNSNNYPPAISTEAISTQINSIPEPPTSSFWVYSSIVLLLAWLVTLFLLLKSKTLSPVEVPKKLKPTPNTKNITKKFSSACHMNNKELCKNLLVEWATQHWAERQFTNLSDVAEMLDGDFKNKVIELNQSLYSSSTNDWDATALLVSFEQYKGKPSENLKNTVIPLKPIRKLL